MPKRIVIHAGFHKTGTTTIQKTMHANAELLKPDFQIVLRADMIALCEYARAYSASNGTLDLDMVHFETAELLRKFSAFNGTVFLSSEDLAGHMPGRYNLKSYAATPKILEAIYSAAIKVFPNTDVSFILGTRAAKPWLTSCYAQHLRAIRITQSADEYSKSHQSSARLDDVVEQVREQLPSDAVTSFSLDDCKTNPLGPLDPILNHLEIPNSTRKQFIKLPPANTSPSQAKMDRLLELNRSDLSKDHLKIAKHALKYQTF